MDILRELWEIHRELFMEWPLGTMLEVLIWILLFFVAGILGRGLFHVLDSWFLPKRRGSGQVVGKHFTPAHTEMVPTYNVALKMTLPTPVYHSDSWAVTIQVGRKQDTMRVSCEWYAYLAVGDDVNVEYVLGRFSRWLYLRGVVK